jgi:hypothetical protein
MTDSVVRISLRDNRFNGLPFDSPPTSINVVIVGVASPARIYYSGEYSADSVRPPTCWSSNAQQPDREVIEENRQSGRCMDCPQNVSGSGGGMRRACSTVQRVAVVLEQDLETVYQLQLPPTSIFPEAENGNMPMRAYGRFLQAHETPPMALVTNVRFDPDSNHAKLFFRSVRPLEEDELEVVSHTMEHPDVEIAVTAKSLTFNEQQASPFDIEDGFEFKNK